MSGGLNWGGGAVKGKQMTSDNGRLFTPATQKLEVHCHFELPSPDSGERRFGFL